MRAIANLVNPDAGFLRRLRERLARVLGSSAWREGFCAALIVALASTMLWRTFLGDWPAGDDHAVHIVRIWQLEQSLLHHGIPWTWSNRWFAGAPIATVYPIGADLLVVAVHLASFGLLGLGQAYGVGFWLFYCFYGYSFYYLVRHIFRSRATGVVAVVFLLTDPGNYDSGGWFWIVDAGVWTGALALAFCFVGTVTLSKLLNAPSPRDAAGLATWLGLAGLCHPLAIVYFAFAIPLLFLSRLAAGERTAWASSLLWLCAAAGSAVLIDCFQLVPQLAAHGYLADLGAPGSSLSDLGSGMITGGLFPRTWHVSDVLGLLGTTVLLFTARRSLPLFAASFAFAAILLSSSSIISLLGPAATAWSNDHMIFPRLLTLAEPFWFAAGAALVVRLIRVCIREAPEPNLQERRPAPVSKSAILSRFAIIALALPCLFHAGGQFVRDQVLTGTHWHSKRKDLAARKQFVEWVGSRTTDSGEVFRIAHGFGADFHKLTDLGIELACPMYKVSDTPTGDHFRYDLHSSSYEALEALSVRFAIAELPLERADFVLEQVFDNRLRVYRFTGWNPHPFTVFGSGEVTLESFGDEEIVLSASPGSTGRLRLNVTQFPKWRATRDGLPLPISRVAVPGVAKSAFMEVALSEGRYRFHYARGYDDYLGTVLCACGVVAVAALRRFRPSKFAKAT